MSLLLVLLLQTQDCNPWCWSMQEGAPGDEAKKVIAQFTDDFYSARAAMVPESAMSLDFPEATLWVDEKEVVAFTAWSHTREMFVTKVGWRSLLKRSPEARAHIAYHEVCHVVLDAERLKDWQRPFSQEERTIVENKAERCAFQLDLLALRKRIEE